MAKEVRKHADRLRIGLIGCGWISEVVHLPNLKANGAVSVVALADHSQARLEAAGRLFPEAARHSTAEALIADPAVQAVLVATPPAANTSIVPAAFSAGKDVYVEKPFANSVAAARVMVSAWERSGRIGMVGYNFRYNPAFERAVACVRSGAMGHVVSVQSCFTWAPGETQDWRADPEAGGGAFFDVASHHLDLFGELAGEPVAWAKSYERSLLRRADTVDLIGGTAGGAVLQLHASVAGGANVNRLLVVGSRGQLDVDLLDPGPRRPVFGDEARTRRDRLARVLSGAHPARFARSPSYEPSFARALDAFAAACLTRRQPQPDLNAGLAVLQVIAAARLSAGSGGSPGAAPGPEILIAPGPGA